jgi:hypothetical protein
MLLAFRVLTRNVKTTKRKERSLMKLTEYIREKDVLEQWPMSKATLIRARQKGLPFVRLGAFVCYKPADLEAHFCQPRSWKAVTPKGKGDRTND